MAILKLHSVKQRAVQTHTIEVNQTEECPRTRQEDRKKLLKAQGKRDQSKKDGKASGRGTVLRVEETYLLSDKTHPTKSCKFLTKCHKLLTEEFKSPKSEVAAVAEESDNEPSGEEFDIYFMVQEDISSITSYMENPDDDIPDLVNDEDSEDECIQMETLEDDMPDLIGDSDSEDECMDGSIESGLMHTEMAFAANEHTRLVIIDTGASLNISPDSMGYPLRSLQTVRVRSVHGLRTLSSGIHHPIWGKIYVDTQTKARIFSFGKLATSKDFEIVPMEDGTFIIRHVPTANTLETFSRGKVLVAEVPEDFGESEVSLNEMILTVQAATDHETSDNFYGIESFERCTTPTSTDYQSYPPWVCAS